jgi:hypothetical protein
MKQACVSWMADVEEPAEVLTGVRIMEGLDPRVVRVADGVVGAARALKDHQGLLDTAPVLMYRGADLKSLEPMSSPPSSWTVSSYALWADSQVWLCGVRQRCQAGAWTAELLRYDQEKSEWVLAGNITDLERFPRCLEPVGHALGEGPPDFLALEKNGLVRKTARAVDTPPK